MSKRSASEVLSPVAREAKKDKRQERKLNFEIVVHPFERSVAPTRKDLYDALIEGAQILIVACSELMADNPRHAEPFHTFKIYLKLKDKAVTENQLKERLLLILDSVGERLDKEPTEFEEILIYSIKSSKKTIAKGKKLYYLFIYLFKYFFISFIFSSDQK